MDKLKILQLKVLLVILEIMLVLLIWTLAQLIYYKSNEAQEEEQAKRITEELVMSKKLKEDSLAPAGEGANITIPEPIPFVLSNFDKIRVVITNKESGGIYHERKEDWQNRKDYRGSIEIYDEENGFVVVNELPVEEYLYSVVPSEMPADYPSEALKAQAICARTYAYLHILSPGYPQWNAHVDDTTAYQVYHNVEEYYTTTNAVNETEGMVLLAPEGNALAQTYYYSTSYGYGSDAHVWRTKYSDYYPYIKSKHINAACRGNCEISDESFVEYIKSINEDDYEVEEGWYRWSYKVEKLDTSHMLKVLQERYRANEELILTQKGTDFISQPIEELKHIRDIKIVKREAGGVADEMLITTDKNTYKVITELNIRYVLNDGCTKVIRQDGVSVAMNSLIPSAFICLENTYEDEGVTGYHITGGGYGHGAGMSQNAAKVMAQKGLKAEEILAVFYENCQVKKKD